MHKKFTIFIAAFLLFIGMTVLLYPAVSSYINQKNGSYAITEFRQKIDKTDMENLKKQRRQAEEYNQAIRNGTPGGAYDQILDYENGMMGYISIPSIGIDLPIYHGVNEEVLTKGVGHMPDSAFPIGGTGNHAVLTGHTGLPSAELFTDLVELEEGDLFAINILKETLTYKVDQIKVVLPSETRDLAAVEGKDYCTLVTCTPYGINSHRLLVRGIRFEDSVETINIQQEEVSTISIQTCFILLSAISALLIATAIAILLILKQKRYRK